MDIASAMNGLSLNNQVIPDLPGRLFIVCVTFHVRRGFGICDLETKITKKQVDKILKELRTYEYLKKTTENDIKVAWASTWGLHDLPIDTQVEQKPKNVCSEAKPKLESKQTYVKPQTKNVQQQTVAVKTNNIKKNNQESIESHIDFEVKKHKKPVLLPPLVESIKTQNPPEFISSGNKSGNRGSDSRTKSNKPWPKTLLSTMDNQALENILKSNEDKLTGLNDFVKTQLEKLKDYGNIVIKIRNLPGNMTTEKLNEFLGTKTLKSNQIVNNIKDSNVKNVKLMDSLIIFESSDTEAKKILSKSGCVLLNYKITITRSDFKELEKFLQLIYRGKNSTKLTLFAENPTSNVSLGPVGAEEKKKRNRKRKRIFYGKKAPA